MTGIKWSRSGRCALSAAAVLSMAAQCVADVESAVPSVPTFAKDVAPILYKNCVRCHREGGVAGSVPFDTYEHVIPKLQEIRQKVSTGAMPPWPVDSNRSLPFRNDPRLDRREIDAVIAWIDGGARFGNAAELPPEPDFTKGWLHPDGRPPDAVISLPRFALSTNGTVPYLARLIKVPYVEDKWISALEVRAGNPRVLHHMGITEVVLPNDMTPEQLGAMDQLAATIGAPSGSLQIQQPIVIDPGRPDAYDMLGIYTPGTTFEAYGNGNGKLLKGGKNVYLNFNIHYTTTGKEESDASQMALWFDSAPPDHVLIRAPSAVDAIMANGRELLVDDPGTKAEGTHYALPPIPSNDASYELIGMTAYTKPITIHQLQPHAHVRATGFRYSVVYPDGTEVSMLSVPHYDYHFQLAYTLSTPLVLPAGSKLVVAAHYDNSLGNRQLQHLGKNDAARRCGPENVAFFRAQNQSWDEMFSPFIQYSVGRDETPRPLIKAVGCLVPTRREWTLQRGSAPIAAVGQGTSAAELKTDLQIGLGKSRYRLLGVDMFAPSGLAGTKVAVRGVLIADVAGVGRINVTSMQGSTIKCP